MQTTAETFGIQFSAIAVSQETRTARINTLADTVGELLQLLKKEAEIETATTGNPALQGEGVWDEFRGNGVDSSPEGINVSVQTAAKAVFDAMDAI